MVCEIVKGRYLSLKLCRVRGWEFILEYLLEETRSINNLCIIHTVSALGMLLLTYGFGIFLLPNLTFNSMCCWRFLKLASKFLSENCFYTNFLFSVDGDQNIMETFFENSVVIKSVHMTLQCPDIHVDLYCGSYPCLNLKRWHALLNAFQHHSSAQLDVLLRAFG